jgi:hypothetical protein
VRLWRALGDRYSSAEVQAELGAMQGDPACACTLVEESVAILREQQAIPRLVRAVSALAHVDCREGRFAAAYAGFSEALTLVRAYGNPRDRLGFTIGLFDVAERLDDVGAADAYLDDAAAVMGALQSGQVRGVHAPARTESRAAYPVPLMLGYRRFSYRMHSTPLRITWPTSL